MGKPYLAVGFSLLVVILALYQLFLHAKAPDIILKRFLVDGSKHSEIIFMDVTELA